MSGVKEQHIQLAASGIVGLCLLHLEENLVQVSGSPSACKVLEALLE